MRPPPKTAFAAALIAATALAGRAGAQPAWLNGDYVEAEGGSSFDGNLRLHGDAFGNGGATSVPFSTGASLKAGYFGGLILGHAWASGVVSLELEGVYTNNLSKSLSLNNFFLTNHVRVENADGFANVKLALPRPLPLYGRFTVTPYVAGGAGGGWTQYSATNYGHVSDSGFAWQGKAGFDVHTGTPWTIDFGYRYIETPRISDHGTLDYVRFRTDAQVASVGVRYSFSAPPPPPPPPPPPEAPPPPPPQALPPAPPPAAQAREFVVYFPFDQSVLTSDAQAIVQQAAQAAQQGPASIAVTGHTDTSGSQAYNLRLSERRAKAVADALGSLGVPTAQMTVSWVGKTDLAVPTPDGVKEPLNRRATITLTPTGG